MHDNKNWFKAALSDKRVQGALLIVYFATNWHPKPDSITATAYRVATSIQSSVAIVPKAKAKIKNNR